jgi:hypothetical protein
MRMHLFTGVQLACFCVVALVKWIPSISIAYPFAILLAVLVRHNVLTHVFTDEELAAVSRGGREGLAQFFDFLVAVRR